MGRKAATWEDSKKNIWKLEVLSDDFEREQEFRKKVKLENPRDSLDWVRILNILLFLFSKLPCFFPCFFVSSLSCAFFL